MMAFRATVCELSGDPAGLERGWQALVDHVRISGSDLVVLPEMPFYPWLPARREADPSQWSQAVEAHDEWLSRLDELAPAAVLGTRPVLIDGAPRNQGFLWSPQDGYRPLRAKYYLPDERGFWEASWYGRGDHQFEPVDHGEMRIGLLICTEIWFFEHGRAYGRNGVHLIATPRATEAATVDKWLVAGRAAAVVSGAYSLSSNRGGLDRNGVQFGGTGWIVSPDGEVLGLTSTENPFCTVELDLAAAERAKQTYPRYVKD